ncbi:hypothetical protein [Stieleria mannarensis]|uniref:hypothetical protein n=1 Tax=Stieleria mannarensis TaxID=2755585 RepID=UPI0015FF3A11|nr:hypothetical protein [Rhodopirellula sp. JC639]
MLDRFPLLRRSGSIATDCPSDPFICKLVDRVPKLRFGLRTLLALPVCVAAFYLGWTSHASHVQSQYARDATLAQQRSDEIQHQLTRQRAARAAAQQDAFEGIEHRKRMQSFERMLRDPAGAKMFPAGTY